MRRRHIDGAARRRRRRSTGAVTTPKTPPSKTPSSAPSSPSAGEEVLGFRSDFERQLFDALPSSRIFVDTVQFSCFCRVEGELWVRNCECVFSWPFALLL
jgi:hypothetical protein